MGKSKRATRSSGDYSNVDRPGDFSDAAWIRIQELVDTKISAVTDVLDTKMQNLKQAKQKKTASG